MNAVVTKSIVRPLNAINLFSASKRQSIWDKNLITSSDHRPKHQSKKIYVQYGHRVYGTRYVSNS